MSKEALLRQINLKAQEEAENTICSASQSAAAQRAKAEEELKAEYDKRIAAFKQEAELALSGQKTLLRLDSQKAELKVRRELIDEVYKRVEERLNALSDGDYRKFIGALIAKYAEKGDKVIIAKRDIERLDANWLSEISQKLDITLSFEDEFHTDSGGIILRGSKFDKNLTFSALVGEARKETESNGASRVCG